jgi:hypothetical protein
MSKDIFWASVMGFIVAVWLYNSPWSDNTKYRQAIQECEQSLPRDQNCKIIAIPISTD